MGYLRETRHYLDDGNVHNLSNLGGGGAHPHLQPTELGSVPTHSSNVLGVYQNLDCFCCDVVF